MSEWFVRKTGANTNGGSSASATPERSGTDMVVTSGDATVTSATAAFVAGDVGKGINIGATSIIYRIASVTSGTEIELERVYAAGTGTDKAWAIGGAVATIAKILSIGSSVAVVRNGDTVWIGAGTYREAVSISMVSLTANGSVIGDVDGVKTGDAGEVIWTGYTTNDVTAPSTSPPLNLQTRDFLTFQRITFVGYYDVSAAAGSTDIVFRDCTFLSGHATGSVTTTSVFATPMNWLFERCIFGPCASAALTVILATGSGSDYDAAFTIRNCLFLSTGVIVKSTGTSANEGGGVIIQNCSFIGGIGVATQTTRVGGSGFAYPVLVKNCVFAGTSSTLNSSEAGNLVEDYNLFLGSLPNVNVSAGAHSPAVDEYAPLISVGNGPLYGSSIRPVGMPMAGSPILGFGSDSTPTALTTDLYGNPRPSGGASALLAAGAMERTNTWGRETTTYHSGTKALSITGPGFQDFSLPVDAVSTTVTVYMRYDATYAGALPSVNVINGTECGVANGSQAMAGAADNWEAVALTFVPTAQGIVTIRLLSSDTNGGGKAFADDVSVTHA